MKPKLSIAIPTHSMLESSYFFKRCLDSLWNQSFQDFEIIVTDNSEDNLIRDICDFYGYVDYFWNERKGMAQNTNEAIKRSKGELIKILYMDDYMAHDKALEKIVHKFDGNWLVSSCKHTINGLDFFNTHEPHYSENIYIGNNTIGSPSVLTIKNDEPLLFDEEMTWLLDCDYYYRMYQKYGVPVILKDVNVILGIHDGQMTNTMGEGRKLKEYEYINKKYA